MIACPECGSTSAEERGGLKTLAYYPPRIIDGVRHQHDGNAIKTGYTCDNGHPFVVVSYDPCPAPDCSFGREPPKIRPGTW